MKKHPFFTVIVILMICGLVVGISATDLWTYIIDFCKVGIELFVNWLSEMIIALRDAFKEATTNAAI